MNILIAEKMIIFVILHKSIIYDFSITFFGVFLGLFAALLVDRIVEKWKLKKELKSKRKDVFSRLKYFAQLLDSILQSSKKQIKDYF